MINREYIQVMAQYGKRMNTNLYSSCAKLDDAQRKTDSGLFFCSIHGTLNHLLFGDITWMSRFFGQANDTPELGIELFDDFEAMRAERKVWDGKIESWASTVDSNWLAKPFSFTSKTDNVWRTQPAWLLVSHMFQHAVHHRGQITAILSRLQIDYGVTDLPLISIEH